MKDFILYSKAFDLHKLAEAEKSLGNKEVVLCRNFTEKELSELKEKLKTEKLPSAFLEKAGENFDQTFSKSLKGRLPKTNEKKFPVHFFTCHLLYNANLKELNKFKNKTDFIGVLGGNVSVNKFAVSNKKIDFLLAPCSEGKLTFDTAIARTAKENKTEILIPFVQFLNSSYSKRVSLAKNYSFMLKIAKKFKLNVRVISFAEDFSELRSLEDLEAFKKLLEKKFEKVTE